MLINIKLARLRKDLPLPFYATEGSAGMDLFAALDYNQKDTGVLLHPSEIMLISTGISLELPNLYEGQIRSRSGLAFKHGITVLNSPGTIDSDYRGEIKVILINLSKQEFLITHGMRIAQLVISQYTKVDIKEVDDINSSERGIGGFGSTGLH